MEEEGRGEGVPEDEVEGFGECAENKSCPSVCLCNGIQRMGWVQKTSQKVGLCTHPLSVPTPSLLYPPHPKMFNWEGVGTTRDGVGTSGMGWGQNDTGA